MAVGWLCLSLEQVFAAPRLDIANSNGAVILSWQGDAFVLQSAQNLTASTIWSNASLPVVANGTNHFAVTHPSNTVAFYRLASATAQGLTLSPDPTTFFVNWDAVSGAQTYNLYLATIPGVTPANYQSLPGGQKFSAVGRPYIIAGLTNGVRYYAVVTANMGAAESGPSPEASAVFGPHAEVSGSIIVNVATGAGQSNSVFVPGAQVWLMNASNGATTTTTTTDLAGNFTFPRQPAGTYTLCYSLSNGFPGCGIVCSTQQIVVGSQTLSLSPLTFTSACTVVYGRVMLDGNFTFQDSDPFFGYDVKAQVKLVNGSGQTNTAPVNESGEFVFLGAPPGSYLLTVNCEGAFVQQNITLPATNGFVLTLPNRQPVLRNARIEDPVTGSEVFQALPGATVRVVIDAIDPDGDALTYDWIPGLGSSVDFQSTNAPSVLWPLPNGNGVHIMYFAVRDHKGGVQTGKVAIDTDPVALFTGAVKLNGGPPTNGVLITINGQTNRADASGYFSLPVTNLTPPYVMTIESEGKEPIFKVFDQPTAGDLYPLRESYEVSFIPNSSNSVVTGGGMTIVFPPNSIVNNVNQPIVTTVVATFSLINADDPLGRFPGSLNRIDGVVNHTLEPFAGFHLALRSPAVRVGDFGKPLFLSSPATVTVPLGTFHPPINTPVPVWNYDKFIGKYRPQPGTFTTNSDNTSLTWRIFEPGVTLAAFTNLTGASITLEIDDSIDLPVKVTVSDPYARTEKITKRFTDFNDLPPGRQVAFQIHEANEVVLTNGCVISNSVVTGPVDTHAYVRLAFPGVPQARKLLALPFGPGSSDYADAYYKAIDPGNAKLTFAAWKTANGFNDVAVGTNVGADAEAIYFNNGDLGFGRWMGMKTNANGDIAYFVSNYGNADKAIEGRRDFHLFGLGATVCMEYSAHPSEPNKRYTKFYVFDESNQRTNGVELDGRGVKFVPHLCIVCHGGTAPPDPVGKGNVDSKFLPFDLESFRYSENTNFTQEAQAAAFKLLNITALRAASTPAISNLVEGWYGGPGFPGNYNKDFIPPGWTNSPAAREVYSKVFKVSCRSCHVSREGNRAFSDYEQLRDFNPERMKSFICPPSPSMPNALRTFNIFWSSQCSPVSQPLILRTNLQLECP